MENSHSQDYFYLSNYYYYYYCYEGTNRKAGCYHGVAISPIPPKKMQKYEGRCTSFLTSSVPIFVTVNVAYHYYYQKTKSELNSPRLFQSQRFWSVWTFIISIALGRSNDTSSAAQKHSKEPPAEDTTAAQSAGQQLIAAGSDRRLLFHLIKNKTKPSHPKHPKTIHPSARRQNSR